MPPPLGDMIINDGALICNVSKVGDVVNRILVAADLGIVFGDVKLVVRHARSPRESLRL